MASLMMLFMLFGNAQLSFATDWDWKGSETNKDLCAGYNTLWTYVGFTSALKTEIDGKDAHDFFLYNVGAKKFVFQGGNWGTKPVLDANKATRFNISYDNIATNFVNQKLGIGQKYYVITSNVGSSTGHWLGFKVDQKDSRDNGLWLDCTKGGNVIYDNFNAYENYKYVCWNFQSDLSSEYNPDGYHTYTIRALYPADEMSDKHEKETCYLYYDKEKDEIIAKDYGAYITDKTQGPNIDPYAQWRLVTVKEIKEKLATLNTADIDDPFNCTFFLKDPYLARYSTENENWNIRVGRTDKVTSGNDALDATKNKNPDITKGLWLGLDSLYTSKLDASTSDGRYGGKDANGKELATSIKEEIARTKGKYFCGQVKDYPASDDNYEYESSFYQHVTIPVSGWYRISCQGFVSTTGNTSYLYAKNHGVKESKNIFRYVRLNDISDFEVVGNGHDKAPTNLTEAGMMFYDEQYTNQVYLYLEADDNLEMGIRFRGENKWCAFDDFGLAFCGKDNIALVLDEDKMNLNYITNAHSKYDKFNGNLLDLHRTFVPHKWNTIVMPVNLTYRQCRELFGSGTKVAELTGFSNGTMLFTRVEHSKTEDSKTIIKANQPYIIKPTLKQEEGFMDAWDEQANPNGYSAESLSYLSNDESSISLTIPLPFTQTLLSKTLNQKADLTYMSGSDFDNSKNMLSVPGTTVKDGNKELTFTGTLTKTYTGTTAKFDLVGKYIVYDGMIYYVDQAYGLDGMRGYFSLNKEAGAKTMKMSVDGVEDENDQVTGIESIFGNKFVAAGNNQGSRVYNLNGQVVSTQGSVEGLPKGIYIINGKKVLVK